MRRSSFKIKIKKFRNEIDYTHLWKISYIFIGSIILLSLPTQGQEPISIHVEESNFYKSHQIPKQAESERLFPIQGKIHAGRRVFGYHPYWMNSSWSQYQWNLLSDLCYFSYEVEPSTGDALTTNNFETATVIDSALWHGVKVHLCVTLFSRHAEFFASSQARRNLYTRVAEKILQRGIHGINIDFEAVPSSLASNFTSFMQELRQYMDSAAPGTEISMATPAVNWSNTLNLPLLNQVCDFFIVMAYDYYWNLSNTAGPVAPLYPMENGYKYSVARTIQYYLGEGIEEKKILLGVPYYGRSWPVETAVAPSAVRGAGSAVTYRSVRLNTALFNWQTKHIEPASRATYYAFQANGWNHCFIDELRDLRLKYDLVNAYSLAGIGIWALGYDYGYGELWQLLAESLGNKYGTSCSDTVYDAGGPAYSPPFFSNKALNIKPASLGPIQLSFPLLTLADARFDLFMGCDTTSLPFTSLYSEDVGVSFTLDSSCIYLIPRTIGPHPYANFAISWRCASASLHGSSESIKLQVFPNPANRVLKILPPQHHRQAQMTITLINLTGNTVYKQNLQSNENPLSIFLPDTLPPGLYFFRLEMQGNIYTSTPIIIR